MTVEASTLPSPEQDARGRDGDVLRFSPNFSVYILPPDVVCLYSEDRKFFFAARFIALWRSGSARAKTSTPFITRFPPTFRPRR